LSTQFITSLRVTVAAAGNPLANALDMVMMSGSNPKCSEANILPVRP